MIAEGNGCDGILGMESKTPSRLRRTNGHATGDHREDISVEYILFNRLSSLPSSPSPDPSVTTAAHQNATTHIQFIQPSPSRWGHRLLFMCVSTFRHRRTVTSSRFDARFDQIDLMLAHDWPGECINTGHPTRTFFRQQQQPR